MIYTPYQLLRPLVHGMNAGQAATHVLQTVRPPTLPIDVTELAQALGARVELSALNSEEGCLTPGDPPVITVNAHNSRNRQRFTIAHEIGHLLMHTLKKQYRDETNVSGRALPPEERQANDFAAHLLMPLWVLGPEAARRRRDITELAHIFGVSPTAMGWQLEKLG